MSSHFRWYPSVDNEFTPWNARYPFPTQASKATKVTPRIVPKNGSDFTPGSVVRMEFPAQGYINPSNTFISFDVVLDWGQSLPHDKGLDTQTQLRIQNCIHSVFSRARLLYGAQPLEDIIDSNVIIRALTEWTATQSDSLDQTTISEGIGGIKPVTLLTSVAGVPTQRTINENIRQWKIQGLTDVDPAVNGGRGCVPNNTVNTCSRRYMIQLPFGLFNQGKMIPIKYMASQLAVELTLASEAQCLFMKSGSATPTRPTYTIKNMQLVPEILEFDAMYDANIVRGLQEGIPIKFSSWHTYQFGVSNTSNINLLIQERSRSVKSIYALLRRTPQSIIFDSGSSLFIPLKNATLQNFQFRIGGRYYPAAPVECSTYVGGSQSNGGAEAFVELQKALCTVGDYRLSSSVNTMRWAYPSIDCAATFSGSSVTFIEDSQYGGTNELDYDWDACGFNATSTLRVIDLNGTIANGVLGSQQFAMATSLETSNGVEISGLNAEEQSDIALRADYSQALPNGWGMYVYVYYDAMIVLEQNNVVRLIV